MDKSKCVTSYPYGDRWERSKLFVYGLVDVLMNINTVRLGLVVYDSAATNLVYLSSLSSKSEIKRLLDAVSSNGYSSTTRGIQTVVRDQFQMNRGDRPDAQVSYFCYLFGNT